MLLECHDTLVTGLEVNVDSLSHKCYGKRLISDDTYKCDSKKTAQLMLNVKQTIEQKQEMFEEFIIVLDELTCCDHLVQELKRKKALLLEVSCAVLAEPCAWSYLCK